MIARLRLALARWLLRGTGYHARRWRKPKAATVTVTFTAPHRSSETCDHGVSLSDPCDLCRLATAR